jgi:hypothetical protein
MTILAARSGAVVNPLFKPNGSPTLIANSLSSGMLLYAFDTGTGLYSLVADCSPGHFINPPHYYGGSPNYDPSDGSGTSPFDPKQSLAVPASTPYGDAIAWPGAAQDSARPGGGTVIEVPGNSALRTAINLKSAGSGAACTIFATHRQTGNTTGGLIFGRGCNLDTSVDICAIRVSSGGVNTNATKVFFSWSTSSADASHSGVIESADSCGMNALCTTVVTLLNTAPGVTDINMYVNGVLEAQSIGTAVCDVSGQTASFEDQFQIGSYFHTQAGQWFNTFAGAIYQCGMANRAWSSGEAASFAASPYQLLTF